MLKQVVVDRLVAIFQTRGLAEEAAFILAPRQFNVSCADDSIFTCDDKATIAGYTIEHWLTNFVKNKFKFHFRFSCLSSPERCKFIAIYWYFFRCWGGALLVSSEAVFVANSESEKAARLALWAKSFDDLLTARPGDYRGVASVLRRQHWTDAAFAFRSETGPLVVFLADSFNGQGGHFAQVLREVLMDVYESIDDLEALLCPKANISKLLAWSYTPINPFEALCLGRWKCVGVLS